MATNIDYVYHPPIDIGVHTPASHCETTCSFQHFRDHLTSPGNTNQSTAKEAPNGSPHAPSKDDLTEERAPEEHATSATHDAPVHDEEAETSSQGDESGRLIDHGGIHPIDDEKRIIEVEAAVDRRGGSTNDEATVDENEDAVAEDLTPDEVGDLPEGDDPSLPDAADVALPNLQGDEVTVIEQQAENEAAKSTKADTSNENESKPKSKLPGMVEAAPASATTEHAAKGDFEADDAVTSVGEKEQRSPSQRLVTNEDESATERTEFVEKADTARPKGEKRADAITALKGVEPTNHDVRPERPRAKSDSRHDDTAVERSLTTASPDQLAKDSSGVGNAGQPSNLTDGSSPPIESEAQEQMPDTRVIEESTNRTPASDRPQAGGSDLVIQDSSKANSRDTLSTVLTRGRDVASTRTQLTEAQQSRLVERVAKAFDIARSRGDSTVRLRLSPPELGALQMELQVERGSLIARLEVETRTAREVLLENLPTLRQRLSEQNITVDQFDVDLLDRQADEDWRGGRERKSWQQGEANSDRSSNTAEHGSEPTTEIHVTREQWITDQVIDVII